MSKIEKLLRFYDILGYIIMIMFPIGVIVSVLLYLIYTPETSFFFLLILFLLCYCIVGMRYIFEITLLREKKIKDIENDI